MCLSLYLLLSVALSTERKSCGRGGGSNRGEPQSGRRIRARARARPPPHTRRPRYVGRLAVRGAAARENKTHHSSAKGKGCAVVGRENARGRACGKNKHEGEKHARGDVREARDDVMARWGCGGFWRRAAAAGAFYAGCVFRGWPVWAGPSVRPFGSQGPSRARARACVAGRRV